MCISNLFDIIINTAEHAVQHLATADCHEKKNPRMQYSLDAIKHEQIMVIN